MRDYRDLRRIYNLSLTQAFFALLEQKRLDVWETLARIGYDQNDHFDFTDKRWKALPVERQIQYASGYQKWYAERLSQPLEKSSDGIVFRLVPPGKFAMQTRYYERELFPDEEHYQEISIPSHLWVGRYPVTQKEYKRVMKKNPSFFRGVSLPVEQVCWYDVEDYCKKANLQLLSEAEWEYACRAGTTTTYSFGEDTDLLKEYAWYFRNSYDKTHPVGEKRANAWGLQDMLGNVWEWTNSLWKADDLLILITRGGCWINSEEVCNSGERSIADRVAQVRYLGFRVKNLYF